MSWVVSPLEGCYAHLLTLTPPNGERRGCYCGHFVFSAAIEYDKLPSNVLACPACTQIAALSRLLAQVVLMANSASVVRIGAVAETAMRYATVRAAVRQSGDRS